MLTETLPRRIARCTDRKLHPFRPAVHGKLRARGVLLALGVELRGLQVLAPTLGHLVLLLRLELLRGGVLLRLREPRTRTQKSHAQKGQQSGAATTTINANWESHDL